MAIKENRYTKLFTVTVCVVLAVLTMAGTLGLVQMKSELNGFHVGNLFQSININLKITSILVLLFCIVGAGILSVWYMHVWNKSQRINISALLLSAVLSAFLIIGYSQEATDRQFLFFDQKFYVKIFYYIGIIALVYSLTISLYRWMDRISCPSYTLSIQPKKQIKLYSFAMGIILLGWLPFIIAGYPGAVPYDTYKQFLEATGKNVLNASNPVFVTYLYGTLFSIGRTLINDNFGVFMCTLFQLILWLFATTRCCVWIYRLSKSKVGYWLSIAFFAIIPSWGAAIQCVLKDTVHTGFFLLFLVSYIKCFAMDDINEGDCVKLFIFSVLTGLSRKSVTAIIIGCLLVLIIYRWKKVEVKKKLIIVSVSVMSLFVIVSTVLNYLPGIVAPLERENYSLPFQQIARYCTEYGSELSEDEIAIINEVLDYDTIVQQYTPDISDKVKATFHSTSSEMTDFWKLYIELGLRHPKVYVDHLLAGTYKYTYPLSVGSNPYRRYIYKDETFSQLNHASESSLNSMAEYFSQWEEGTITKLLIGPGLYVWALLTLTAYALHKKRYRAILSILPVIILYAGLYLSHVNGENRYALPLMAAIPMCAAIVFHSKPNKEQLLKE
mgnify:CR=1 FL=1